MYNIRPGLFHSINPNPHRVFSKHPAKCNRMHTAEMRTLLNATTCNSAFCCIVQGTHHAVAFVPKCLPC